MEHHQHKLDCCDFSYVIIHTSNCTNTTPPLHTHTHTRIHSEEAVPGAMTQPLQPQLDEYTHTY